jgi:hypothetical protein
MLTIWATTRVSIRTHLCGITLRPVKSVTIGWTTGNIFPHRVWDQFIGLHPVLLPSSCDTDVWSCARTHFWHHSLKCLFLTSTPPLRLFSVVISHKRKIKAVFKRWINLLMCALQYFLFSLRDLFSERSGSHYNRTFTMPACNTCTHDNNLTQIEFYASVRPLEGRRSVSPSWGHFSGTVDWACASGQ